MKQRQQNCRCRVAAAGFAYQFAFGFEAEFFDMLGCFIKMLLATNDFDVFRFKQRRQPFNRALQERILTDELDQLLGV